MGSKCTCDCDRENSLILSKNLYELGEAMEEENYLLSREATTGMNPMYKLKLNEFINLSNTYIKMFKSVPSDNMPHEDFVHLREVVNKCYYNLGSDEDFNNFKKEMEYLVDIKMAHSLGLSH